MESETMLLIKAVIDKNNLTNVNWLNLDQSVTNPGS